MEREHHKARVALSLTPEQQGIIAIQEQQVEQGCQILKSLLVRLALQHQYKHFRKRRITYERAKTMNAREFSMLGLSHAEALRLANTLSYATAVSNSYNDVRINTQKAHVQGAPLLFRDNSHAKVQRLVSPSTQQRKHQQRRLSALGRDLLDVFQENVQ